MKNKLIYPEIKTNSYTIDQIILWKENALNKKKNQKNMSI